MPDDEDPSSQRSARDLQRSLQDNVGRYQVEPVGMVNRTHVFRGVCHCTAARLHYCTG